MKVTTKNKDSRQAFSVSALKPLDEEKYKSEFKTKNRWYIRIYVRPRFIVYGEYLIPGLKDNGAQIVGFTIFFNDERKVINGKPYMQMWHIMNNWCDLHEDDYSLKLLV